MIAKLIEIVQVVKEKDPAATNSITIILTYPIINVMFHYYIARYLFRKNFKLNYRVTQLVSDLKHSLMTLTSVRKVVTNKFFNQIICAQLLSSPQYEMPTWSLINLVIYIYIYI